MRRVKSTTAALVLPSDMVDDRLNSAITDLGRCGRCPLRYHRRRWSPTRCPKRGHGLIIGRASGASDEHRGITGLYR